MSSFYDTHGRLLGDSGISDITDTIGEAIELSVIYDHCLVTFDFNGVTINVLSTSSPDLIYRDWTRVAQGFISGPIGPNPSLALSREEQASDDRIAARNADKRRVAAADRNKSITDRTRALDARLSEAPPMEVSNMSAWQVWQTRSRNENYYTIVVPVAERWARLMQLEMAKGKKLEDVAVATSYEADVVKLMSGAARYEAAWILEQCWRYGKELKQLLERHRLT